MEKKIDKPYMGDIPAMPGMGAEMGAAMPMMPMMPMVCCPVICFPMMPMMGPGPCMAPMDQGPGMGGPFMPGMGGPFMPGMGYGPGPGPGMGLGPGAMLGYCPFMPGMGQESGFNMPTMPMMDEREE